MDNDLEAFLTFEFWHIQLSTPPPGRRWSCPRYPPLSGTTGPPLQEGHDILSQQVWRREKMIHAQMLASTRHTHYRKHTPNTVNSVSQLHNWGFSKNHLTQWTTKRESLRGKRHLSLDRDSETDYRPPSPSLHYHVHLSILLRDTGFHRGHHWRLSGVLAERCLLDANVRKQHETVRWSIVERDLVLPQNVNRVRC